MKNLCRRRKSQFFAGTVIQSVFNYFNFLVVDIFRREFLRHILTQQTIEVFIRPTLPARKGPRKVARTLRRLVNQRMPTESFAVFVGQSLDPGLQECGRLDDRLAYTASRFV